MELELHTHCEVSVDVKPVWYKGKRHPYRSRNEELAAAEDQTSVPNIHVSVGPSVTTVLVYQLSVAQKGSQGNPR